MFPNLLHFGKFSVHAYGLCLAIGFLLGMLRMVKVSEKYGINKDYIYDLGIFILLAGVIGSRLLYVLCNIHEYTLKSAFSVWEGGLSFQGGIILGIIVGWIYAYFRKLNMWTVLDILCPSVCIGYAVTRIGCFLNGCCYGIESSMPWAVPMCDSKVMCEPVQLYSCAISFLMFFLLTKFEFKSKKPGLVFNMYLIFYGVYRFFIEFIRHHIASDYLFWNLSGGQVMALGMVIAGLILYYFRFKNNRRIN